ncbi:MoxR family ATPase [Streptomyces sp. GC420]|uniref:AAA family ATPase n=1 Tax=Streptomyces sp. GC420 TaxID=2697568 RepID=UPI0014150EC1|nr:MoxR family ATPase [Streptomyces sp. GC420]NBM18771.1 AAA domain-containing protein [Streptomyces sp. GC420]
MGYIKRFDPELLEPQGRQPGGPGPEQPAGRPDDEVYLFDDRTVLAVNIALATGRPLLVLGPPGSGKSTLAPNVARLLGHRYYAEVVTARTEPHDLLWREEPFRQLNDAQQGRLRGPGSREYFRPGPLWKALDPAMDETAGPELRERPAVVLIDEIDKAEPDVPDALLDPLNNLRFEGPHRRLVSAAPGIGAPLVVITSNEERELSAAFRRRCIPLTLRTPGREHLLRVAELHMGTDYDPALAGRLADVFENGRVSVRDRASTAEFLDTLRACRQMGLTADSDEWRRVADFAMVKDASDAPSAV